MKKFFIQQWFGDLKLFVVKTYSGRIIHSSKKYDALHFTKSGAEKYLIKLQKIDNYNKLEIRELL